MVENSSPGESKSGQAETQSETDEYNADLARPDKLCGQGLRSLKATGASNIWGVGNNLRK